MKYLNLNTLPKGYSNCLFEGTSYWVINDKTKQEIFICAKGFDYLKEQFPNLLIPLELYNQIKFPQWIQVIAEYTPETKLPEIKEFDVFEEDEEMCNTLRKIVTIEMVEEKLKDFIIDIPNSI